MLRYQRKINIIINRLVCAELLEASQETPSTPPIRNSAPFHNDVTRTHLSVEALVGVVGAHGEEALVEGVRLVERDAVRLLLERRRVIVRVADDDVDVERRRVGGTSAVPRNHLKTAMTSLCENL